MLDHNPSTMADVCEIKGIHTDIVGKVAKKLPLSGDINDLAYFFKLFGDGTRLRILGALSESEMCVCDLCALLSMKQSAVSHQLKNLKQSRVVKARREGKVIYYALDDDHIRRLLDLGMEHLKEMSL